MAVGTAKQACHFIAHGVSRRCLCDIDRLTGFVGSQEHASVSVFGIIEIAIHIRKNALDSSSRISLALFGAVHGPEGFDGMAECVAHGGSFLVVGKGLQGIGIHQDSPRDKALTCHTLLGPVIVDDRITGRFAAGTGCSRHGQEGDPVGHDLLFEPGPVLSVPREIGIEFDALGNIHGGTSADGHDRIAALCPENSNALHDTLIEGVGLKIGKIDNRHIDLIELAANIRQEPDGIVTYQEDLLPAPEPFIEPFIVFFRCYDLLFHTHTPQTSAGIMRMISLKGISMASHSCALWFSRIICAAFCMAGTSARMSWLA